MYSTLCGTSEVIILLNQKYSQHLFSFNIAFLIFYFFLNVSRNHNTLQTTPFCALICEEPMTSLSVVLGWLSVGFSQRETEAGVGRVGEWRIQIRFICLFPPVSLTGSCFLNSHSCYEAPSPPFQLSLGTGCPCPLHVVFPLLRVSRSLIIPCHSLHLANAFIKVSILASFVILASWICLFW